MFGNNLAVTGPKKDNGNTTCPNVHFVWEEMERAGGAQSLNTTSPSKITATGGNILDNNNSVVFKTLISVKPL